MWINRILIKPILDVLCSFTVWTTEYSGVLFPWPWQWFCHSSEIANETLNPQSPVLDQESTGLTWDGHLFSLRCILFTYVSISILVSAIDLTLWIGITHTTVNTFPPSGWSLTMRMLLNSFGLMALLRICDGRVGNQAPLFIPPTVLLCFPI